MIQGEPGASERVKDRRRRYHLLVRKDLQLKSLQVVGVALLGMMGFIGAVGYGIVTWVIHRLPPPAAALEWWRQVLPVIQVDLFWGGVGCVAVATFVALIVSHRIAAPLLRIETELKRALHRTEGFSPVRVRESDGLQEFADEMNRLVEEWRKDVSGSEQGIPGKIGEGSKERSTTS